VKQSFFVELAGHGVTFVIRLVYVSASSCVIGAGNT
jgi:hypothetical protein